MQNSDGGSPSGTMTERRIRSCSVMRFSPRRAQILVVEGCPHLRATLERVRVAFAVMGTPARVEVVYVKSVSEAARLRFLGSPSVRVDDVDVEPGATERANFGIQCRIYSV